MSRAALTTEGAERGVFLPVLVSQELGLLRYHVCNQILNHERKDECIKRCFRAMDTFELLPTSSLTR